MSDHTDPKVIAAYAIYDQLVADHASKDDEGDAFATVSGMIAVMASKSIGDALIAKGSTDGAELMMDLAGFLQLFTQGIADLTVVHVGMAMAKTRDAANDQGAA
jgi:hypothetical protein